MERDMFALLLVDSGTVDKQSLLRKKGLYPCLPWCAPKLDGKG